MTQHVTQKSTDDRSTAELLKQLTEQIRTLITDELALARAELTAKGKRAGMGAGMFGGAGIIALYGAGALVAAAIMGLSAAMPGWAAALIIGIVLLAGAGVMAMMGRAQTRKVGSPMPQEAVGSVKRDVDVIKQRAHH